MVFRALCLQVTATVRAAAYSSLFVHSGQFESQTGITRRSSGTSKAAHLLRKFYCAALARYAPCGRSTCPLNLALNIQQAIVNQISDCKKIILIAGGVGAVMPSMSVALAWHVPNLWGVSDVASFLYALHFIPIWALCSFAGLVNNFKFVAPSELALVLPIAGVVFGFLYAGCAWLILRKRLKSQKVQNI